MAFAVKLTTGPTVEPVTLDQAKDHLFVNGAASDGDIIAKIAEARADVEGETGRALLTQTWKLILDRFPCGRLPITLPIPPCQSVTSVKYYDVDGTQQTLNASTYWATVDGEPARITPKPAYNWPATDLTRPESVEVVFVAGYGAAASAIPPDLVGAFKLILGDRWRNRGDESKAATMPEGARRILTNYRAPDSLAGGPNG